MIDINPMSFWNKLSSMPEENINEIYIKSGNDKIIYHSDINRIYTNFGYLRMTEDPKDSTSFTMNGRLLTGTKGHLKNSRWTVYSLRDKSEMNGLMDRYTKITVGAFGAVLLILIAAISVGSERIAKPLQSYTKMINDYRLDEEDSENTSEILTPSGCTETAHLALSFNDLIGRYRSLLGEMKDMNIRLEKEQKLYQTALQSSSDVIFEYDIDTDALITYGSLFDSTADKTVENLHSEFVKSVMNGKKYRALSQGDAVKFFNGDCENSVVISRTGEDKTTHWVSFEGTPLLSNGRPVKIVGKLSLIDDMMNLKEVAEREPFSGLYNKTATKRLISDKLSDNIYGAMLIIDIDNFKSVNDRLGHAIGDEVIKNVVNKINSVINPADIAGRIGGDEFMVYAANADESSAAKLCESLCGIIKSDVSSEDITVRISASIGAAVSPVHGRTFDELYRCADIAMYVTKSGGKDNFTIYDGQERPEYHGRTSDM